jgi:cation diffusion facilitator CzcD-associated flavoprotein CzcO
MLLCAEIFKYQRHCVDKYGLAPHIRLSTRVTAAAFDADSGSWSITTSAGDTVTARVLVLAQGDHLQHSSCVCRLLCMLLARRVVSMLFLLRWTE